jgi:cell division protein FtsA
VVEGSLVLGIDAGSASVVAVLADIAEGEPQVIGVGLVPCIGIRKGVVVDLGAAAEAMRQAEAKAREMAGRSDGARTILGISGAHLLSMVGAAAVPVHRPSQGVTPEDIRIVLDRAANVELSAGREVIHVVPRAYRLDGTEGVMDPLGLGGKHLSAEAHLITGETLLVQNYLRSAAQAGLEVADYQVAIRAAGDAVLTREEREAGVLLMDFGAGTTSVAVYDRGHLWHVAIIPVGGEHITTDVASILRTPVPTAEQLKVHQGWASVELAPDTYLELVSPSGQKVREVEEKRLAEIIESRVQEILQLAAVQVKRSGYAGLFPAGLVLTGGGSRLRGLDQVAADSLGLPVRVAAPDGPLVSEPSYATAVGLVHWGARLVRDEAAAAAESVQIGRWSRVKNWLRHLLG